MLTEEKDKINALNIYNDGKFKRLNLMFAVNGGAFAILKLLLEKSSEGLPGKLSLSHVAFGAIVFTIVMIADTWYWSSTMKREFLGQLALSLFGKIALILLSVLIIAAWILVGFF